MPSRSRRTATGPQLTDRLLALAGLVVIVGAAVAGLWAIGVLGNQGGGEGIEDVALLDTPRPPELADVSVGVAPGDLARDFEISDFDGTRHRLSEFRGQPVYINVWATWCVPCVIELPEMHQLLRENEDLAIITVNRRQSLGRAMDFLAALPRHDGGEGLDFTVNGMDPDDTLYHEYRGLGMPVSVFVNPEGVVTRVYQGLIRLEQMEEAVEEARRPLAELTSAAQ